jgi:hypothetical protein
MTINNTAAIRGFLRQKRNRFRGPTFRGVSIRRGAHTSGVNSVDYLAAMRSISSTICLTIFSFHHLTEIVGFNPIGKPLSPADN